MSKVKQLSDLLINNNLKTVEKKSLSKGLSSEIEDGLIESIFDDDSNCEYKVGDKVVTITEEPGNVFPKGTKGIVLGAFEEEGVEYYLVMFNEHKSITLKYKIGLDESNR